MGLNLPTTYVAARNALAACRRVDEVKDIRDKAIAMEVYAKQAKDGELIGMATEIRGRAERRLGEIMAQDKEAGRLAGPGRKKTNRVSEKPNLKDRGIDKNLANRARKAAAMPEAKFEADLVRKAKIAVAATEGVQSVISEARAERHAEMKKKRASREQELAAKIKALPQKQYGVIYADPEWKFEAYSEKGLTNSSAANHYPTSDLEEIKKRNVPSISAADCVLFLWATAPMLPHALEVMEAWGFEYRSQMVWVKHRAGTGYWFRNQHELLLVGVRGKIPAPAQGSQWSSVLSADARKHSQKPDQVYEMIEELFPELPKIELNARIKRPGWDAWGLEA